MYCAHSMKTPYGMYFKVNDGNNINKNLWSTFYIYRAVRYFNDVIRSKICLSKEIKLWCTCTCSLIKNFTFSSVKFVLSYLESISEVNFPQLSILLLMIITQFFFSKKEVLFLPEMRLESGVFRPVFFQQPMLLVLFVLFQIQHILDEWNSTTIIYHFIKVVHKFVQKLQVSLRN